MLRNLFNTYELVQSPYEVTEDPFLTEIHDSFIPEDSITLGQDTYRGITNQLKPLKVYKAPEKIKEEPIQKEVKLKSSKEFEAAFQEACRINPDVEKYKVFLVKTAKRESGFNSHIQNQAGAPYYGYFQMGQKEIKATTGLTVEQFRNDPVQQILGAVKLYKMNLNSIKNLGVYQIGKQKGYSDDALVAGAWMGGPGGVKKYLLGLGDPSDSHWYKDGKGGSSVGKVMNNWRDNE